MSFDDSQKQYAGILELLIPELSLTVIGLVTTRIRTAATVSRCS